MWQGKTLSDLETEKHAALDEASKGINEQAFIARFGISMLEGMVANSYVTTIKARYGARVVLTPQGAKLLLDYEGLYGKVT